MNPPADPDCPCQVDWHPDERIGCPQCATATASTAGDAAQLAWRFLSQPIEEARRLVAKAAV
jgi:hypothetical protein